MWPTVAWTALGQELISGIVGLGTEVQKSLKLAWPSDPAIVLLTTQSGNCP